MGETHPRRARDPFRNVVIRVHMPATAAKGAQEMAKETWIRLRNGYRIWSRTVGTGTGTPLLTLHGGPGAGHDYLEPLEALGRDRPVIFYDQLGCGRSDKPDAKPLWTIERFADEIDEVRAALGLKTIHLLGQSWGGWLAVEYLTRKPKGLKSCVLASTSASIPLFAKECARLIAKMPKPMQKALSEHGATGHYGHPDYQAALMEFYRRHLCRMPVWPDCLNKSAAELDGNQVYETINGPNEFTTIGNLRYWDRTQELAKVKTPALLTCGRHDELGPVCSRAMKAKLRNAKMKVFEKSAHVAHIEEPEAYRATVAKFLREHD
jgi:proline-specific peptidase